MEELISYLDDNFITNKVIDSNLINIDGKICVLVKPNEEGKLFTDNLTLITEIFKEDFYIFKFGGIWYYTPCGTETSPKFNILKYFGKAIDEIGFMNVPFLGIHGKYEILNGSRDYNDWCSKAKFFGIETLGICEKNTLAGVLNFQLSCQKNNIKPIIGATYTVDRNGLKYDIKLYVRNNIGWYNLLKINKHVKVEEGQFIYEKDLLKLLGGLFVVLDPKSLEFENIFPLDLKIKDNIFYQLDTVEFDSNDFDKNYLINLKKYFESDIPPIFIIDAYYLDKEDAHIKTKLNTIKGDFELKSSNQYFKNANEWIIELDTLFNKEDVRFDESVNNAIKNVNYISENSDFFINTTERHLPIYEMKPDESKIFKTNEDLFWYLIEKGLSDKNIPESELEFYIKRVETEFNVIEKGGVIDYFLILWDIIDWCHKNDILTGIARGSAGGSLIAYLMGITFINPIEFNLLFERFLNEGRIQVSLPDIDCDFPQKDREDVKKYMQIRYGYNNVCSVATYSTLKLKAIIKDLAKIHNIPFKDVNFLTSLIKDENGDFTSFIKEASGNSYIKNFVQKYPNLVNDIHLTYKGIKSESIHACATIIVPQGKEIYDWFPVKIVNKNDEDILISEWEGEELDSAGFLKEDILGIQQLDKIKFIVDSVKKETGEIIDIYSIPLDVEEVYLYFRNGWNGDVFHFGSKGLTNYCKELQPENIEDLIAGISLYRPGAMENNFHNEYILRKEGKRDVEYYIGCKDLTKETYGLIIYQETIMKICQEVAGFSLVEADNIRKAMGKKKKDLIDSYMTTFKERSIERGFGEKELDELWDIMKEFSKYAFNRSHAAAYTITGYISQYLKVNYPIHFWTTAFSFANEDDIPIYISEIFKTKNISLSPVDINKSDTNFKANYETNTIYWSLESIKQCGEKAVNQIMSDREDKGDYFSFEEFIERHNFTGSKVNKAVIENLILGGAFDDIENIADQKQRINLIELFRKIKVVKVDTEKDLFETNKNLLVDNWWWEIQQKKISGFSFFDFDKLCEDFLDSNDLPYIDNRNIFESENVGDKVKFGGYVNEIKVKKGKKSEFAQITLESNYEFVKLTIWSQEWSQLKDILENSVGKLILLTGEIYHDAYHQSNSIQTFDESEIIILE
jgi:DNA polymerase-3 subunit alpha